MTSILFHVVTQRRSPSPSRPQPVSKALNAPAGATVFMAANVGEAVASTDLALVAPQLPLGGPCPDAGLFLGPDHSRRFVSGLGRCMTPPPVKANLDAVLGAELLTGLEKVTR